MLSPGTRLGPYEIEAPLGAGGMGEVYRGRDTRLGRTVAIKVIANRWRERPDLRTRFRIEAEAIAALNHPHVAQLFDVGQQDDLDYLVMELVEGETLATRLGQGRLPADDVMAYARALAAALEHAHRRGITHRDVKPANAVITRAGLKLLDFGLARIDDRPAPAAAVSTVAATAGPLTQTGAALGTWQYMSPEQARGEPADARSDVFALGSVIYEMLTGRAPFARPTQHETIAAILDEDPPAMAAAGARSVTASVEAVVRACLAKDPADRWQSAGDVRRALDTATAAATGSTAAQPRRRTGFLVAGLGALVLAAFAAAIWPSRRQAETAAHTVRSTVELPPGVFVETGSGDVAFAPDGRSVVYATGANPFELRRYRVTDGSDSAIAGTQGGYAPFISPDGQWVGFFASGQLKKVSIDGGTPVTLCAAQSAFGASWGDDGNIVFSHMPETGLFRIAATGGTPELITKLSPEDAGNDHRYPQVLPRGRGLLFAVATGPEETARIVVVDSRTGRRKPLLQGAASARFVPPGHVAYARNGELFLSPFSLDQLEITGAPRRIATGVAELTDGAPEFSFSAAGDLVYVAGSGPPANRLAFVDLKGAVTLAESPPQFATGPRISPDGRTIAYYVGAAKNNVWLFDSDRGTTARRTFGRFHEPVWRPDGRLTAAEGGPGSQRIVLLSADGSGSNDVLIDQHQAQFPESWSPDGRRLIYRAFQPDGHWDLWLFEQPNRQRRAITASPFDETAARFSPDGRWIAYVSNETGRPEIHVRSSETTGGRWPISSNGANRAAWAPTGRRIYYRDLADGLWAVDVSETPAFSASRPRLLFRTPQLGTAFDVTPDGQRFVTFQQDATRHVTRLHLVLNPLATVGVDAVR